MRRVLCILTIILVGFNTAVAGEHAIHLCAGEHDPVISRTGRVRHQLSGGVSMVQTNNRTYRTPYTPEQSHPLWISGESGNRLDIVIVGDGYSESDQSKFQADAQKLVDRMFREEPFRTYQNYINVHRVDLVSEDSGIDNDPAFGIEKNTPLHSLFYCNGQERALCVDVAATKAAAAIAPGADQIVVIVNSSKYGGVAYFNDDIATLSGSNVHSLELFFHEFAHSFGNLADEYSSGGAYSGSEFSRKNVSVYDSNQMSTLQAKWHAWVGYQDPALGLIDSFEGAWNYSQGAFRPSYDSKMRSLGQPFNAPSIEALILELYQYVQLVDFSRANDETITKPEVLYIKPLEPIGNGLDLQWYLDSQPLASATGPYLDLASLALELGRSYNVRVEVVDRTSAVRNDASRDALMSQAIQWTVVLDTRAFENDTDGDGVYDVQEHLEDTGVSDSGSYEQIISKSACTLPNGYLEQVNIVSISNPSAFAMSGVASFRDNAGVMRSQVGFTLSPGQKTDFIVNDMGLEPNTIGTFCVKTDREGWSGGLTIYKPDATSSQNDFDFALYYPFEEPATGARHLPLNTNAIGTNGLGLVANWVRVSDATPGDGENLNGQMLFYSSNGSLLNIVDVRLPDGGRVDLPGHEMLGAGRVGSARFVPSTSKAQYYFEATRYFYKGVGASELRFYTALAIPTSLPSGTKRFGFVQAENDVLTVVESVNALANASDARLEVFNSDGTRKSSAELSFAAHASNHYVVEQSSISPGTTGTATIEGEKEALSSISVSYTFDQDGTLVSAYANSFGHAGGRIQYGEFNSFIDHRSVIDVQNTSNSRVSTFIDVIDYNNNAIYHTRVTLAPHESKLVKPLLPLNSYGTIRIQSGLDNLLRVRTRIERESQYTLPIIAR